MRPLEATGSLRRIAAGVALFDATGRLLLVHENYGKRRWDLPGGTSESSEAPNETAIRETREEVGVAVAPCGLIGLYLSRRKARLVFVFRARYTGEPITLQADELDGYRWCLPDDLPPLTAWKRQQVMDAFAWDGTTMLRCRP